MSHPRVPRGLSGGAALIMLEAWASPLAPVIVGVAMPTLRSHHERHHRAVPHHRPLALTDRLTAAARSKPTTFTDVLASHESARL
jgi:hypothetical protein